MDSTRRYGAFLSYSHADTGVARWLHKRLEAWRTPKALQGRPGQFGPVPGRIGRVYRDRDESAAGGKLREEIETALTASDALVVLCSPASAASIHVNREVAHFKALGRADRIVPLIVAGDPPACWPAALQDGGDLLCADLRKGKDGREHGLVKVLAGLLGLGLDELVQRERAQRRRRLRWLGTGVLVFASLTVVACGAAYVALDRSERLQGALVDMLDTIIDDLDDVFVKTEAGLVSTADSLRALQRAERQVNVAFRLAPKNDRLQLEEARMHVAFARLYMQAGRRQEARASVARSEAIFADFTARGHVLPEQDLWVEAIAANTLGDIDLGEGKFDAALAAFERMLALSRAGARQADTMIALTRIGLIQQQREQYEAAQASFTESLGIARAESERKPGDIDFRRGVLAALNNLGDLHRARGDTQAALAVFEEGLGIARVISAEVPASTMYRRDVGVMLQRTGALLQERGDLSAALARYEENLANARSYEQDAEHQIYQSDVSVALENVGAIYRLQGRLLVAEEHYRSALAISEKLMAQDPDNRLFRELVLNQLGGIVRIRRELQDAEGTAVAARRLVAQIDADAAMGMLTADSAVLQLLDLSWRALFDRDYVGAEDAARRGLRLNASELGLLVNLAHALMLQGRPAEADVIYDAHRGEPRRPGDSRLWEDVVAADFAELRTAGLGHPHMQAVLARLGR